MLFLIKPWFDAAKAMQDMTKNATQVTSSYCHTVQQNLEKQFPTKINKALSSNRRK